MSQISDIVNVQIELNTNFTSTDSFDHICVIGQRPKKWTDWAASTAYVVGDVVVSGTHVYACETAGSSGDAAPDHTSGTAADGTVTWKYKSEIPDDVGLYGLLGVLEVVMPAQEGDVRGRAHLAHLPGQLDARDEGHAYVRQQQIRLQLFDQLEGVQPVAGVSNKAEAQLLPGYHGADGLPELVLVVRDYDGVKRLRAHLDPVLSHALRVFSPL